MFEMMSLQITSLVLAALAVLVAAYIVFRGHSTAQPTRRVPGARPAPPRAGSQTTAAELLVLLKQLDAENAQWTKILSVINPTGDRAIAALEGGTLVALVRAAGDFVKPLRVLNPRP